jgi:hypothetical protein
MSLLKWLKEDPADVSFRADSRIRAGKKGFWEDTTTFAKTENTSSPANTPEVAGDIKLKLFDPLTQVSADAKYIVRNLVICFLVVPIVLGAIIWLVTR